MHGCIGPPWAPWFSNFQDAPGIGFAERFFNAQVGVRKTVRPGQRPHGDILRSPFTDAGKVVELFQGFFDATARFQQQTAARHRLRQSNQGPRPLFCDAQGGHIADHGPGNPLWKRKCSFE